MIINVAAYIGTAVIFLLGDLAWLGTVGKSFYKSQLGGLLAEKPALVPTVIFYLLFVLGIVIFGVYPGLRDASWKSALLYGGLFGFFGYALYDLTNLATLKGWSSSVSVVDIVWGTVLTALASTAGYLAAAAAS